MKIANISVLNQNPCNYFMLQNIDDLIEYQELLNGELEESFHKIITSSVEPRKWSHLLNENSQGDTTIAHSILKCEAEGGNPLLKAPALAQQKINRIKQHISNGETVIVNMKGGYCFLDKNTEILSVDEYVRKDKRVYHIGENTKIINLENDPELEKRTIEYFEEQNDNNPSYILNLRSFSKSDLIKVFTEFQEKGGSQVYVYTTAMDIPQMREYCEAIVEAGIKEVVFEFNAGMNPDIEAVVDDLKTKIPSVNIL